MSVDAIPARAPSDPSGPTTSSEDLDGSETPGNGPIYYRYIDTKGVIYITRDKPAHGEYEILRR